MSGSELARGSGPSSATFEEIEEAVMESERGRWFLEEYARRQRAQETQALLSALSRLEAAVKSNQDMIAERLTKTLGLITTMDAKMAQTPGAPPQARPAGEPHHANYFAQDEELFEPMAATAPAPAKPEPKIETAKGATLVIRRRNEVEQAPEAAAQSGVPSEAEAFTEAQPKSRIVIIRHKAGEEIDVPMQDEFRETA